MYKITGIFNRILRFFSFRIFGRKNTRRLFIDLCKAVDLELLQLAYHDLGINAYGSIKDTGEEYFLKSVLSRRVKDEPGVLFDIGANVGNYSLYLGDLFPSAQIHSFEPNPSSFQQLAINTGGSPNIVIHNLGIGKEISQLALHTYSGHPSSEHATMFKEVMTEQHGSTECIELLVDVTDLDSFCNKNNINKIDFLKIDTEGFELSVLQGATNLINARAIDVIQFEFNEMNIYSRVFLHDFYRLLGGYSFYRLKAEHLIPLGKYDSKNEIFKFQNIIAFRNV